jgi:hypothetical protein
MSLKTQIKKHLFLKAMQQHPVFAKMVEVYDFILDHIETREFKAD